MIPFIISVINGLYPTLRDVIKRWQDRKGTTALPSLEELVAELQESFRANIAEGRDEWTEWKASHPNA